MDASFQFKIIDQDMNATCQMQYLGNEFNLGIISSLYHVSTRDGCLHTRWWNKGTIWYSLLVWNGALDKDK